MNYFSLESKDLKLERNKAFSVVLMLLLYKEYGNYFDFLVFSQCRRRSILHQEETVKPTLFT